MICTYTSPVYTRIESYTTPRKSVCVYSRKGNFDKVLKSNKRMRYAIKKHKVSKKLKNDSNKIIIEELVSILDVLDDVMDVLADDETIRNMEDTIDVYMSNCGEIPDEDFLNYIDKRGWP